jgi:G:T-mismatch repair DNA endonuclease (very short patch repair protein)
MLKVNKDGKYECCICHEVSYDSVRSLSVHLGKCHHMDAKTYYDEHVKLTGEGICKVCGAPTKFRSLGDGYKETCSHKCGSILLKSDPDKMAAKKAKTEATCLERFGVTNGGGSKEALEKAQKTNMERRGVAWNMQSKEVLDKSKATCLDKYGATTFVHSEVGQAEVIATVRAKFGRDNFFSGKEGHDAAVKGMIAKHNVDNPMRVPKILAAHMEADKARNGGKFFVQTDEFKDMSRISQFNKYGNWHSASDEGKRTVIAKYNSGMQQYGCIIDSMDDKEHVMFTCARCGHQSTESSNFIKFRIRHDITPCPVCYTKSEPTSIEEGELRTFVESLGFTVTHYDRDFLGSGGADIVVEDKKLIIEYDGLYWHSELYRDSDYHANKTRLAAEKGYRLIHVFSDEWVYSRHIVKSRLASILGRWDYDGGVRVPARECEVREVTSSDADDFLHRNHLQGAIQSKWRIGLYHNGQLVSLMTFGQNRFGDGVELHRFCNKVGVTVIGGASRLFSHFVNAHTDINELTTFADARWSERDAFYIKLGFSYESTSAPGYYIVDGDIRRNRMQFQRHKIAGPGDEGKTEHEITLERGLFRIYDCGQYKYRWTRFTKEA